METLLTFPFDIPDLHDYPILRNEEARKQASIRADPKFSGAKVPKGTEFTVRATVNEKGMVTDGGEPKPSGDRPVHWRRNGTADVDVKAV